tara:strand:- start:502 stop:627 length:126 start_codon:yes stop_codon:yes gene_type:complete
MKNEDNFSTKAISELFKKTRFQKTATKPTSKSKLKKKTVAN